MSGQFGTIGKTKSHKIPNTGNFLGSILDLGALGFFAMFKSPSVGFVSSTKRFTHTLANSPGIILIL